MSLSRKCGLAVFPLLLAFSGCKFDGSITTSVNTSTGQVTVGGTLHIAPNQNVTAMDLADFEAAPASGYSVIVNVPTSDFVLDSNATPQVTLTATTDQGYTSSIVVNLQPASSTTSPVASGYTPYTFQLPNTAELQSWTEQVSQQSASTVSVSANTDTVFDDIGNPGSYTIYAQVNSTQTGLVSSGSATVMTAPKKGTGCVSSGSSTRCPVQN